MTILPKSKPGYFVNSWTHWLYWQCELCLKAFILRDINFKCFIFFMLHSYFSQANFPGHCNRNSFGRRC